MCWATTVGIAILRFGGMTMFSRIWSVSNRTFTMLSAIAFFAAATPAVFANPWSWTLGDAKSVQHRTKDIAERLNREFPYSQATSFALHMDNAACQMVDDIKCGASWEQVQASLSRTCALAAQVNELANADCNVRNDKRTRNHINDLSKRIERLRCSLDKAYAKTQPKFCPQPIVAQRPNWGVQPQADPFATTPIGGWNNSFQMRVVPSNPSHMERCLPGQESRFQSQLYPRDTYEIDSAPYSEQPYRGPVGPIEYRVERNVPNHARTAALVQLGLQAIKLMADNR